MKTNNLSRRSFLKWTAVSASGALLAACAPQSAQPSNPTPKPAEATSTPKPVEATPAPKQHSITVAWHTGGESVNKIFAQAADKFDQAHPNYKTTRITEPWGPYMDKLLVMYASGTAPDAHTIPWGWYGVFAEKGGLMPIDDFAKRDAAELKPEDLWPAAWDGMLYKGKRLGLPRETMAVFLIAYNKELFAKAGAKTPLDYYKAGDWTWDRWREVAKAFTVRNNDRFEQVGCNFPVIREGLDVMLKMWGSTAGLYNADDTQINLTDQKFYDIVKFFQDTIIVDKSVIPPGEKTDIDWMASGKQAMSYDATFSIPNSKVNWKFDWDFAPSPKGPGGFFSVAGYDFYGVNAKAKDAEGGWEWIKFMNLPDMTLWWGENMYGMPFHKSESDKWLESVKKNPPPSAGWDLVPEMAAASVGVPNTVAENVFQTEWENKIFPVFRGEAKAEDVLPAVKKVVDAELNKAAK
jgi:multiple sugar transport system substrate-binding protein